MSVENATTFVKRRSQGPVASGRWPEDQLPVASGRWPETSGVSLRPPATGNRLLSRGRVIGNRYTSLRRRLAGDGFRLSGRGILRGRCGRNGIGGGGADGCRRVVGEPFLEIGLGVDGVLA